MGFINPQNSQIVVVFKLKVINPRTVNQVATFIKTPSLQFKRERPGNGMVLRVAGSKARLGPLQR
jgi:hypothetical protein